MTREPSDAAAPAVELRPVEPPDVLVFFEHQRDTEAVRMAAFASRDREEHVAHWSGILRDRSAVARSVLVAGEVVGNVVSWPQDSERLVGYWIARERWGRGIATRAVGLFLEEVRDRPLVAYVAESNFGSIRVLEKCGFTRPEGGRPHIDDDGVAEFRMELLPRQAEER